MKIWLVACVVVYCVQSSAAGSVQPFPFPVNGFVGTGGHGFGAGSMPVGAQVPFGNVRVSPDTAIDGLRIPFDNFGGYQYDDNQVMAFSHTHMVGSGASDLGAIGIMPFPSALTDKILSCSNGLLSSASLSTPWSKARFHQMRQLREMQRKKTPIDVGSTDHDQFRVCNWLLPFSHQNEVAQPGYYSVDINNPADEGASVQVELTATQWTAAHRFTFGSNSSHASLILDLCHTIAYNPNNCRNVSVTLSNDASELYGFVFSAGDYSGRFGGITNYFSIHLPNSVASFGMWQNGKMLPGQRSIQGVDTGAYITFTTNPSAPTVIETAIGISMISIDMARANLRAQQGVPGSDLSLMSFDQVQQAASLTWQTLLSSVAPVVVGGTDLETELFYTHLYQSHFAPTNWTESDGSYLGFDKQVHHISETPQLITGIYTDMSIWDIARTQFPLLVWLQPQIAADIAHSLIVIASQLGGDAYLPKWLMANGDTHGMDALHSVWMLGDAHFGPTSFKMDSHALNLVATSLRSQQGPGYVERGYFNSHSPCQTLEFAMDDWCAARMAASLGNASMAQAFSASSAFWRNVFHPEKQFFCARDASKNGSWIDCNMPDAEWQLEALNWLSNEYVEGDAWHYRFWAPHDMDALIATYGDDKFNTALQQLFVGEETSKQQTLLPDSYYWAGNEPSLFSVFGFAHMADAATGASRLQQHARWILSHKYTNKPSGEPGNNDYGTMSAWYVFGALGFWPLPCGGRFYLGSPAMQHVVLNLNGVGGDNTRMLEVKVTNWSEKNTQVAQIILDGSLVFDSKNAKPGDLILSSEAFMQGSHVLEFVMLPSMK